MDRFRQSFIYPAILILVIVAWIGLWGSGILSGLEHEALRWRYQVRGHKSSTAPIVYVDLDAQTIRRIGDKPWDRLNFAQVAHAVLGVGEAKAMGVDLIFSRIGAGGLLDSEKARAGNFAFGQAVEAYEDRLVLAAAYTGTTSDVAELPLRRRGYILPEMVTFPEAPTFPIIKFDKGRLGLANIDEELNAGSIPRVVMGVVETAGEGFSRHLIAGQLLYFQSILNDPQVVEEGDQIKLVDADGFPTASIPLYSERRLFTLGLEVFLAAHGLDANDVEWTEDALFIRRGDELFRQIPLVDSQSIEVNWFQSWGAAKPEERVSMATVLEKAHALGSAAQSNDQEKVEELESWFSRFKDKVVFLGPVDATLKDIAPTPFDRIPVPKVSVHTNLYRTIQDQAFLKKTGPFVTIAAIVILSTLVSALGLWGGRGRRLSRAGSFLLLIAYAGAVFYCFARFNLVFPLIAPIGAALNAVLVVSVLKLGSEEWQRRRIKSLFGSYVSPKLVDEMIESNRDPELGGTETEITALFSDVEGFAALSEQLTPVELVGLMNEYLSAMTDAQQLQGGTLDKYIGDAIVTMFGMPLPLPDHAGRACVSAMRMQERHAELRETWTLSGKWPKVVNGMRTRIGLNTGRAVIGNMGSRVRFNYTMMGDSVNLAARCESAAKIYGVYTMVTETTINEAIETVPDLFYRRLDRIVVKGRSRPVEVFELWDSTILREEAEACRDLYEAGLEFYFVGEWVSAEVKFRQSLEFEPARSYAPTTPSGVLLKRCQKFISKGGPADWDGAYRMDTK